MHLCSFNYLKFTLKHLKRSYVFRSYDHPQAAYIVPCWSYSLKTLSDLHRYVELVLWQHAAQRNDVNQWVFLDYNFNKEQCVLPEDDRMIEKRKSVF